MNNCHFIVIDVTDMDICQGNVLSGSDEEGSRERKGEWKKHKGIKT